MQLGDQFKRQSMVASYDVEACLNQSPPKRKLRKGAKRTPMVFLGEGTSSQGAEQTSLENYGSEPSNSPFDNTFYIKDESEYETPIFNLDDEEECFDRTKSSLINFDIKNIIEQDLLLNAIRNKSLKREPLTNFEREKISDFLVKHFMNELGKLNNDDFTYLAKKIEEYFPGEKRLTYFVPPVPKSKSSTNVSQTAKGKLPDKQRNITSVINKIKSRGRKQKTDDKALKDTKALSIPQSARDSLTWLKQNLPQSLDEVKQHWNNSYPIRKTLRENDGNIETFLENWPILKLDDYIKELVNFDFKKIFGWKNEDSVKDINFNVFFNGILQARKYCLSITDNTTLDVLKSSELTSDSRIAIQLHLLPSLVPPKGRMYVGTGQWKPSIQECRDGLLIHVKDPEDIEAAKAQQARFLLSKNQPVLPYILLVGNSLSNISQAFVVFNNKEYICASVFQALDFCFKLHHVFGAKYSFSCAHIWYLIQWKLYNIHTKSDKKITFINDLI